jgi:predicted ArsR family transcriptional regulator
MTLTHEHKHLVLQLKGNPRGMTRTELAYRLRLGDRTVRQLIEDLVAGGHLPIVADRTDGGEARYRIAGRDEIDLVATEHHELVSRALSLHRRAKGLLNGWQSYHQGGALFMPATEDLA